MLVGHDSNKILSSLPLEVLTFFNWWYIFFYLTVSFCLFLYKSFRFYYAPNTITWEIFMLFLLSFLEILRLYFSSKGNKTEQLSSLVISFSLSVPIILGYAYFIALQTFVLKIDLILNSISFFFVGFELILSITTATNFYNAFRG